jgi:hypothetical protein
MSEHKALVVQPMSLDDIARKMASGHSVFSPSGAEMSMTCSGSLIPNALAHDDTSYESAEGSVAHAVGEEWITSSFERPDHLIGLVDDSFGGFEIEINEEMMGYVEDYVDICREIADWSEYYFAEKRVDTSDLTPIPGQGGTMDFAGFRWQKMKIVDLKYGKEPVFAFYIDEGKINKQLAVYAWGIFLEWDWLYNFQEIELVIVQPRLPHVVSRHTMTRQELIEFADFARERWALAWQPNAPRTPSIRGCRWCKIRATCPANYLFMANDLDVFDAMDDDIIDVVATNVTYSDIEMKGANEVILDEFATSPFPSMPKPAELSTAALAKLLRYRKHMENFFNAVAGELTDRAISNEEDIPWWKLVESRTRRKLVEDEDHIVEVLTGVGLKKSAIYKTIMKSPAELERELHTTLKMKAADAKRLLDDGLTVKPPGQKTLAPTSDNRRALDKDGDVFDSLDDI